MWGRNSEAYSECPYLTGEFAHEVVRGMRSDERGGARGPSLPSLSTLSAPCVCWYALRCVCGVP